MSIGDFFYSSMNVYDNEKITDKLVSYHFTMKFGLYFLATTFRGRIYSLFCTDHCKQNRSFFEKDMILF